MVKLKKEKKEVSVCLMENNFFELNSLRKNINYKFENLVEVRGFHNECSFFNWIRKRPDIVIMNIDFENSFDIIEQIKEKSPKSKIIIFTKDNKIKNIVKSLNLGVSNYIIKQNGSLDNLIIELEDKVSVILGEKNKPNKYNILKTFFN